MSDIVEIRKLVEQMAEQERQRARKAKQADDMVYCDACFNRAQGIESVVKLLRHLEEPVGREER